MRATVIFNGAAGSADDQELARIQELLPSLSVEFLVLEEGQSPVDAAVEAAVASEVVIASGGDGTVSAVASALAGRLDRRLGILPRGTANSIAGGLGIPSELEAACKVIEAGHTRIIDTAVVNDRRMVLVATIGVHADSVAGVDGQLKSALGPLAYALEEAKRLLQDELFEFEILANGHQWTGHANGITVANLAPKVNLLAQGTDVIQPDDGELDVTVVAIEGLGEAITTSAHLATRAWSEQSSDLPNVLAFRTKEIRINTLAPRKVMLDGDYMATTPVDISIAPQSLRVCVPSTP